MGTNVSNTGVDRDVEPFLTLQHNHCEEEEEGLNLMLDRVGGASNESHFAQTSACFLANDESSAFRFCTMPSTLLELNSLRGGRGGRENAPCYYWRHWSPNAPHQLWTYLLMSDRCFSKTNGFSESRELCRQTGGWNGTVRGATPEGSDLVLVRLQNVRDVFSGRRLQVHQLLLQVWDLWESSHSEIGDETRDSGLVQIKNRASSAPNPSVPRDPRPDPAPSR